MTRVQFPEGFVWGTATSAYQIEGAANEDGRGESIWDRFSKSDSHIEDGSTGDVACDHYHRWREDVGLMKQLAIGAYRFSVAWPRIIPVGRGAINPRGLEFYDRLVDALLAHGIVPFVTLYHWDLPQPLQDEGGWTARSTALSFVEYADVVSRRLGDRVKNWITHNEPWCSSLLGYQIGKHAPGIRDWPSALASSHHILLSHGLATPVIRRNSPGAKVGIALNLSPYVAASPSPEDADACRHLDGWMNRWFLDPIFRGSYPADMIADYTKSGYLPADGPPGLAPASGGPPFVQPGDLATISVANDFLGINYYNRGVVRSDKIPEEKNQPRTVFIAPKSEWTDMGWEVYPQGLFDILSRVHADYHPPKIYVTENGASYSEGPDAGGRVADVRRVRFVRDHLLAARRAISEGVPLAGYFLWSLMDNFEWDRGYTQRFGAVWVDYKTQRRIPKDTAHWYTKVITENSVPVD
jgi:beta-glucosidase